MNPYNDCDRQNQNIKAPTKSPNVDNSASAVNSLRKVPFARRLAFHFGTAPARLALSLACIVVFSNSAFADVFQWEFIDPSNPSLGKQESATLAPGGAGANFDWILGLTGRDLTKGYLFQARMRQFRVSSTILNDAYLAEADMYNLQGNQIVARGADMSRSNLEIARFGSADLAGTRFNGANLTGANLGGATLTGATFGNANVVNIHLNNVTAHGFTAQQLYETASYQQGNLGSIELAVNNLTGWDFSDLQMENANFAETQLTNAVFSNALVTAADFSFSNLSPTQLYATRSYQNRQLDDMEFSSMDLSDWDFSNQSMARVRINNTDLSGANFDGANLTNANLGRDFTWQTNVSFRGANLANATFVTNGRWENTDFTGANLEGANLSNNHFLNSKFDDAIIRGTELSFVVGPTGFNLQNLYSTASYKTGDLTNIEIRSGNLTDADFQSKDVSGTLFIGIGLDSTDFRGAKAIGTYFGGTLEGADFRNANLTNASFTYDPVAFIDFRGANLTGAHFERTSLKNADFTGATVFGARLSVENSPKDLTAQQLYSTASYQAGLLGPITLAGDMRTWDFRNQDLTGARFDRDSNLEGAMWAGAKLQQTLFFVNSLTGTDFRAADVRRVMFSASTLDDSNFTGADLSNAEFTQASLVRVRFDHALLAGTRFVRTDLTDASFIDADLRGADFVFSDSFAGANFSGADIRGADFSYATSDGFTISQLRSTRSYQERDLSGVNFEGVNFSGVDLSGIRFAGGDFNRANLAGANLRNADLTGVSFLYADVAGLDLTDAVVRRADFNNADSEGFTREMLESTASYKSHRLDGIDLSNNDLRNWNFNGQDLREARFSGSTITGALFQLADLRGAILPTSPGFVNFQRAIRPDGYLTLLRIDAGETFTIRKAPTLVGPQPTNPREPVDPSLIPLGVKVIGLTAQISGTLELVLDESEWKSTIVFDSRAEVLIDGILNLRFDELANPSAAVGKSYNLFDWPTAAPNGEFDVITDPKHVWDLSQLYTTGVVQLVAVVPEPSSLCIAILSSAVLLHRIGRRRDRSS